MQAWSHLNGKGREVAQKNHRLQWNPPIGPMATSLHEERHRWRPEVVLLKLKDQSKAGDPVAKTGKGPAGLVDQLLLSFPVNLGSR